MMARGYPQSSIKPCYFNHQTRLSRANSPHHHSNCGKFHKCFASPRQKLIVFAQSSLVIHPAKCSLDYPSKFHDFKYLSGSFNHRPNDIEKGKSPVNQTGASVSTISPNQFNRTEENHKLRHNQSCASPVLNAC